MLAWGPMPGCHTLGCFCLACTCTPPLPPSTPPLAPPQYTHPPPQVHRQKQTSLVRTLHAIRDGSISLPDCAGWLAGLHAACCRPLPADDGILPTFLYCRNIDTQVGARRITQLSSPASAA